MPEAHSKYSASAAHRWLNCPGSQVLEAGLPNNGSIYADEGTAAHELAALCLDDGSNAEAYIGRLIQVGERSIEVTDDMARHVQTYVDNVRDYAKGADSLLVEVKVNYSEWLNAARDEAWGTSDVVILHGDEIQVHDLKFGRGEEVDAERNDQMQLYALGALSEYDGLAGDFTQVRMVIHQPRIKSAPSEWTCSVEDLKVYAQRARSGVCSVQNATADFKHNGGFAPSSESAMLYLRPGEKQCRWCKAKATCPALRAEIASTVFEDQPATADEFEALPPVTVDEQSPDGWLAACMAKADLIEDWIKAVRAEVERRLLAGTPVEGYKLVQGRQGSRAWSDAKEVEEVLKGMRLRQEQMYEFKLISPTAAEKLLKDESPRRWTKLQQYITCADGKPSVAPLSDKRPALEVKPAADDFEAVTESFDDLA